MQPIAHNNRPRGVRQSVGLGSRIGRLLTRSRRVPNMLRSMLGQMVLATVLFVGCGVYTFAIAPILSMPPLGLPDPQTATMAAARTPFMTLVSTPGLNRDAVKAVLDEPLIREIRRRNPGFGFYIRQGDAVYSDRLPTHWRSIGLERIDAARRTIDDPALCTQMEKNTVDAQGVGYVFYSHCSELHYLEIGGIRQAIAIPAPTPMQAYVRWLWSYSRNFLVPSLGVFLVLVTILLINVLRIRRVARLTDALNADVPDRLLPEAGLPSEVIPLVRSMNVLIARLDDAQRQRRFFLSAAAHEIRTPLTILRTRMESLPDDEIKTKLVRDLSRLTTLSDDLLTLMNIDARKRPFVPVDLDLCCLGVIGDLEELAVHKDVRFVFRQQGGPTIVQGDAALLEVAIKNLVDNALSFAPAGSSVIVTLDGEGGIEVRDHGRGLPSTDANALFEPFVRMGTQRPGHGLGLAIVRSVTDLHGATVSASNAAGGGARFTMRFPNVLPV